MRWTPAALDELRSLSARGYTMKQAGNHFGCGRASVCCAASREGISFPRKARAPATPDEKLRAKWAKILPKLRENLRRDIQDVA